MVGRKQSNTHTTISIRWEDKELFRKYAQPIKDTKNGVMNESDSALFKRILGVYQQSHVLPSDAKPKKTYPDKG
tara:strand:+ start:340 stop:561 length:222 start_codon:yes stop_codon:yes gene_type:complete